METITDKQTNKTLELIPAGDYHYKSKRQKLIADDRNAEYIFVRPGRDLPTWVVRVLQTVGLSAECIGYTTGVSATFVAFYR